MTRWPHLATGLHYNGVVDVWRCGRWAMVSEGEADEMERNEVARVTAARAEYDALMAHRAEKAAKEAAARAQEPPCGGCHYSCCRYCGTD